MKSVLVTGSHGRVGRITVDHLLRGGYDVRGVDLRAAETPIKHLAVDLSDPEQAERAAAGMDTVIHLAASLAEDGWPDILRHNIVATRNIYEAARKAGIRRIILASSHHAAGMYPITSEIGPSDPPRPDSLYGLSKSFSEDLGR